MKKLYVVIVTITLLCASATVAYGNYGARATAMGGAFAAVADDGFAPYYNPAGMTQLKTLALTGSIGVYGTEFDALVTGFGGITTSSLAGNVYFDEFIYLDGSYIANFNFVLSAATTLFSKSLSIGGNAKIISDVYGYGDFSYSGASYAYDLGVLFKPSNFVNIAMVGRNLNEPAVVMMDEYGNTVQYLDEYGNVVDFAITHPSSTIIGIALKPSSSTTAAADLEIIGDQKIVHMGLEQTALWNAIALRVGMKADLDRIGETQVISIGGGLKIFGLYADIAIIGINKDYPGVEMTGGFRW